MTDLLDIATWLCSEKKKNKRDDEEGRIYGRGDEEIVNKKKWEYEEGEVIIWRRCAEIQYWSRKIENQRRKIWNLWKNNGDFMDFFCYTSNKYFDVLFYLCKLITYYICAHFN